MVWNYRIQTSQTGDQPYSIPSPYGECSLVEQYLYEEAKYFIQTIFMFQWQAKR